MQENLNFKISSGLKNIIGKELITNEYVAIFELVKNSFDAHATRVQIFFENIYKDNSKIVIVDNGKGMDINDIKNKWLFVAYSAKKDGTEDDNEINDYRKKLKSIRGFAGAKGVGRFSCDRLGSKLNMITIKNKNNSVIENLRIDWKNFEVNSKEEFIDINIQHGRLSSHKYDIKNGTILEITGLRDKWNRDKLSKLKSSLEKLINPNQQKETFSIEIVADEELMRDKQEKEINKKINGPIKNTIFEVLNIKTTSISVSISKDGKTVSTSLSDRGKLIYKIVEYNNSALKNINIELFYLNRLAKINFTKNMGIQPVRYGSVFLYKNGFRIYPFGEEGEDPLKLDRRKAQGTKRYLGTRELIGRMEINGSNEDFIETSSRDGGLIRNDSYKELVEVFYDKALKRLEKYVVQIIRWGEDFEQDGIKRNSLSPEDVTEEITKYIQKLTNSKEFVHVEYEQDFKDIISERQDKSLNNTISKLKKEINQVENDSLYNGIKRIENDFKELIEERNSLEVEKETKEEQLKRTNKELEHTTKHNLFLSSVSTSDTKEIISLQHQINHGTVSIARNIDRLRESISDNAPAEHLLHLVDKISLENSKISTIAKFVTKANFDLTANTIKQDLIQFVNQYIENVYQHYEHLKINKQLLNVSINTPKNLSFSYKFRPLEIIIIIDNLLGNSQKASSKNVVISWKTIGDKLKVSFKDDGKGIPDKNLDKIFDFGFTTTDGSGVGLYHVKQLIEKLGWIIEVNNKLSTGVEFILEVNNES
ncbi:sensor histidine kinase [Bacillus halotolerans]|uniref:sensor histidine kinase n=1 Tax=Bacillus halotolerans TaxID=260554 RepID=UPI0003A225CF|nr:ATP-binding protein [Bacillus halotolerans]UYO32287.1 ATP-binding protein [Bacillus halotolerans]